jgi:hypothetical protein
MIEPEKQSLFERLMKKEANLYEKKGQLDEEAHADRTHVPLADHLLKKMMEEFDVKTIEGVAKELGMSQHDVEEALNILALSSVIEEVGGKHAMLYIIEPDHECFFDTGTVPDGLETPDMNGEKGKFSFEAVERSVLGVLMLIRFTLVEREGVELRPRPEFPDVPQNVFDGKPGQTNTEVTFEKCDKCGEYTVLCTCGKEAA